MFEYFFNKTKISPEKAALFSVGNSKVKEQVQLVNEVQRRFDKNNNLESNRRSLFELYGFNFNKYQSSILNYRKNFKLVHKPVHNTTDNVDNPFCALDNNARYMLSFDNNKSSDTDLLI
jgi:hypothetical protein